MTYGPTRLFVLQILFDNGTWVCGSGTNRVLQHRDAFPFEQETLSVQLSTTALW